MKWISHVDSTKLFPHLPTTASRNILSQHKTPAPTAEAKGKQCKLLQPLSWKHGDQESLSNRSFVVKARTVQDLSEPRSINISCSVSEKEDSCIWSHGAIEAQEKTE